MAGRLRGRPPLCGLVLRLLLAAGGYAAAAGGREAGLHDGPAAPDRPAARLLGAAILAYERGDEDIRQAVDDAALEEIPKLERHINLLGTLGFIMPLVGFLGTVLGMMRTFQVVGASEYLSTADIAGAVNMALITTAAALVVAIPSYLGYNYLIARVNSITLDMEKASLEIIAFFERRRAETGGEEQ